jgi:diguanylate cyclase (GGDEF)-like protein/putative nucleotidyltransferase with HDIG domain
MTETTFPVGEIEPSGLSLRAWAYLAVVLCAAAAVPLVLSQRLEHVSPEEWVTFTVLASAAALAQLFVVLTPRNQSYHTTAVLLIPAALLLPPELLPLVAVAQHVPEWIKERYAWYIQAFNISNYTLDLVAAAVVVRGVMRLEGIVPDDRLRFAVAGVLAAVVFLLLNHGILANMLRLARGHSILETGLFTFESLSTDLVLAWLGVLVAFVWDVNPALVPLALAPVLLIHRSLAVPQLQEEARVDPKTGLFNARHFTAVLDAELDRAERFGRPLSLLMLDLDLLREINNVHGHLAGDAVLTGIAQVFRRHVRHYDAAARFGGEEFAIVLPETPIEEALEIAERLRASVAEERFEAQTVDEPLRATVSIGVATYPRDGATPAALIHEADLAVYRAKVQGRNRVVEASSDPLVSPRPTVPLPAPTHVEDGDHVVRLPASERSRPPAGRPVEERRRLPARARGADGRGLRPLALLVGAAGVAVGVAALLLWPPADAPGFLAVAALVVAGQALALRAENGSISVGAVGMLAGAALFGAGAALVLALCSVLVDWSVSRIPVHKAIFNLGMLTFSSLTAAAVFAASPFASGSPAAAVLGLAAGAAYFVVNTGLIAAAVSFEERTRPVELWTQRFGWLFPHYVAYGFVASVVAVAYGAAHIYALLVFAVPLLLMRRAQETSIRHTRESAEKLREAAETIHRQNVSLEQANHLLRERSTAAMEGLSATVDARDSYTAGHSRRVQRLALEIGGALDLSAKELEVLGYAALLHDIGKIAIPDAILLKSGPLTDGEWATMRSHTDEGATIVSRLGFLNDAVPAIRHHHERYDGAGYPDGLAGDDIPLGARIIHVADALDSMLTTRIYRSERPLDEALAELARQASAQFCPRCVDAAARIVGELRLQPTPELHRLAS